jgi:hypothetical protein
MMGRKEAILTMSGAVMKYLVSVQEFFFDRITPHSAGQAWMFRIKNIKNYPVNLHQNY